MLRRPLFRVGITALTALFFSATACAQTPVFINEIHYDNANTDAGEAIEIAGPAGTDLSGWSLVLYNGSNGQTYNTTSLNTTIQDAGNGYGFVSKNYPSNGIQNGSRDGIALIDNFNNVVQFLSYEGVLTATDGPAVGMISTDINSSESSSTPLGFSLQLSGSGIYAEDFSWNAAEIASFGLLNNNQTFSNTTGPNTAIVINEVDADNASTDTAEFIELYDGGSGNSPLDGLVMVLYNGSDDASYRAFDLDGYSTNANGYFVLCANTATVVNCDLDVSPDSNLIQNGADAIALYIGDETDFPNDTPITTNNLIDALVYGTNDATDNALLALLNTGEIQLNDTNSESLQRCPNGAGGQRNTNGFEVHLPSPGDNNVCQAPAVSKFIHEIQGTGDTSPIVGSAVSVEAVVVGDFQSEDELNGFYLQEEDSDTDNDANTSEGIFVYAPASIDVKPGDIVRVTADVAEFSGLTELTNVSSIEIINSANTTVTPASLKFPVSSGSDLESIEGMQVRTTQALVIAEYFNYDRFGEMVLALPQAGYDRPFQPTAVVTPGAQAIALQQENQRRRITLDDGSTRSNPAILRHPNGQTFALDNLFRGGDSISGVSGVMDYRFGRYRIQPIAAANHISSNARQNQPDTVGGDIKVASFNVLNYFTTLDTGPAICGPSQTLDCRGADNAEEFERQRTKILAALQAIDADIIGLVELENNATSSIADLVDGLNVTAGAGTYAFIDTGTIGTDAIKVGLIYRTHMVKPLGSFKVLDNSVDSRFIDDKNRPVLAQSFVALNSAARLTVAVNHLKSKGSSCNDLNDPDTGDGQANCNNTRTQAALAEVDWLATDPTASGDTDILIIGDLNAYAKEDPITAIQLGADKQDGTADDYTNLIDFFGGEAAYSFVFDGQFGYLDHALASASLTPQVTGITEWHINSDEADALDYTTRFKPPEQIALYEPNAFRASDHDPVIVGLQLKATINDIKQFVDNAIAEGSLVGHGPAPQQALNRFQRSFTQAVTTTANGQTRASCARLMQAQQWSDGRSPRDAVSGQSARIVSGMIDNYRQGAC